ncbi:MAG: CBS domain-containing protein [Burkholderiaceae bacterium]
MTRISEVMTTNVRVVRPDETVQDAARVMAEMDIGAIPVCDGKRLQGMITDRDITIRATAEGRGGDTPVNEVMTRDVVWCSEEDDTQEVLVRMGDAQIRRIPVVDQDRDLVGIVALGDLAIEDEENVDEALRDISMPA